MDRQWLQPMARTASRRDIETVVGHHDDQSQWDSTITKAIEDYLRCRHRRELLISMIDHDAVRYLSDRIKEIIATAENPVVRFEYRMHDHVMIVYVYQDKRAWRCAKLEQSMLIERAWPGSHDEASIGIIISAGIALEITRHSAVPTRIDLV